MRKILALFFFLSCATYVSANFQLPMDRDGVDAETLSSVGVEVFSVRYSSAASLISGSTIAVYGVMTSTKSGESVGVQSFVELRSTNTANLTSELLVPPIEFSSTTRNSFVWFSPPVISPVGVSVNISTVGDAFASVFYRYLSTGTSPDFWIPRDDRGHKAHNPDFFGVKVATQVIAGGAADGVGTEGFDRTSDELLVSGERGLLYGVFPSTGPTTSYVVFEDTGSVLGNTADFLPPLFYRSTVYENDTNGVTGNRPFYFKYPLIFVNGLTQQRNSTADRFRVFVRPLRRLRE